MCIIEMGCEYLLVINIQIDLQEVVNLFFDEFGLVCQDVWLCLLGFFVGVGSMFLVVMVVMLVNDLEVLLVVFEVQEFMLVVLVNVQCIGMGKLLFDCYFWVCELEDFVDLDVLFFIN